MIDKKLYKRGNILVTTTRVVIGGSIYPVNSLSAVKSTYSEEKVQGGDFAYVIKAVLFLSIIFTFGCMINSFSNRVDKDAQNFAITSVITGSIVMIICAFYLIYATSIRRCYHVEIYTGGADTQIYSSYDNNEINRIVSAINKAIINRG